MDDYAVEVERIIKAMMKSPLPPLIRGTSTQVAPIRGGAEGGGVLWGEFFPASMSRFGYNETEANEYYPLSREEILNKSVISSEVERSFGELNKGLNINNVINKEQIPPLQSEWRLTFLHWTIFKWSDYIQPLPKVDKIIPANMLPSKTKDIPDDILNWALKCEETWKPYRINKAELKFYRDNKLSVPRFHYDTRYKHRLLSKNQRIIYDRKCDKCSKDIKTTYSKDMKEIVYCEECYNKTIY